MNSRTTWAMILLALCAIVVTGCVSTSSGKVARGKVPATIEILPHTNNTTNRLNSQHLFIARVTDAKGLPVGGAMVEWILQRHVCQVGDIVDVDCANCCGAGKLTNTYARGTTARKAFTLPNGVEIGPGETWLMITSSFPGDTNVIAYARDIENWQAHKVFGVKHWGPDYDDGCDGGNGCAPGSVPVTVWVQKGGGPATSYVVDFMPEGGVSVNPSSCVISGLAPDSMDRGSCSVEVVAQTAGSYVINYTITPQGSAETGACCCPGSDEPVHQGQCVASFDAGAVSCALTPVNATVCPGDPAEFDLTISNVSNCDIGGMAVNAMASGCCAGTVSFSTAPPTNLAAGMVWNGRVVAQTQNCGATDSCMVDVTVSSASVTSTSCNAAVGFGASAISCTLEAQNRGICPGDDAVFRLCIYNNGSCASGNVQPAITVTHNGSPLGIMPSADCAWPQNIPAGGSYCCTLTLMGNQLPESGSVCLDVDLGNGQRCSDCVQPGSISVTCDKRFTNGDATGRVELGGDAIFDVRIGNTSSCTVTINSISDNPTCGTADDSACQALVGSQLAPGQFVNCQVVVNTNGCDPEMTGLMNNFSVTVGAGAASASTQCSAPFGVFVIPAMECSFVDTVDPVYVDREPNQTTLKWRYLQQGERSVKGVEFMYWIPPEFALVPSESAAAVDVSAAPHFQGATIQVTRETHTGINYVKIYMKATRPIDPEEEGEINITVKAVRAGDVKSTGNWKFSGFNNWIGEDTGTTVR